MNFNVIFYLTQIASFQRVINVNIIYWFWYYLLEIRCVSHTHSTSRFRPATFQVLSSRVVNG